MLSEKKIGVNDYLDEGLNPLYIVECFRRIDGLTVFICVEVLIHCISWNAFGDTPNGRRAVAFTSLNPLYIVECFRSRRFIITLRSITS